MASLAQTSAWQPWLRDGILGVVFCFIGPFLPKLEPQGKDLAGKTAIVTGANSGVGYGLALQLAEMGATVYLACRNKSKAEQAKKDILKDCPGARITTLSLDTSSFKSVRSFAQDFKHGPIDILAHNAGISIIPNGQDFSEDGLEYMYQVNFLSSFLLTYLLEEHLSADARVIFTSSLGSYAGRLWDGFATGKTRMKIEPGFHSAPYSASNSTRYGQNKLMQAAFAKALQARFATQHGSKRLAFSFEPGLVKSNILSTLSQAAFDPALWALSKLQQAVGLDVRQGSATGVDLATSDAASVVQHGGRYFDRMQVRTHAVDSYGEDKLNRLWKRWSKDCGIHWVD
ncbi:hypothetical protein AC578_7084 [Pseudocercospora eumusae]|uniref:NAD(P)-binding protein n=1 Tax=Pseudocercospora eumusae TaxID=321146 RepID=A0A139HWF4_9PEZI|nr:hypothetical protein AC578_7084 [Pseudocercospora eumusae]